TCIFPGMLLHQSLCFFFQAEDGIRDRTVTGVQTCALPISTASGGASSRSGGACTGALRPSVRVCSSERCEEGIGAALTPDQGAQIGRASCRERVEIMVVAVS